MDEGDIAGIWHKVFAEIGLVPCSLVTSPSRRFTYIIALFDLTPTCRVHAGIALSFTRARITVARVPIRATSYRSLVANWDTATPPTDVFRRCLGGVGICKCLHPLEDHRVMRPTSEVRCHVCWACRVYRELE